MADEKKILVVDDEPDCVEFVSEVIEDMGGYTVVTACDGQEGVEKAKAEMPVLIVMDVNMPRKDGHTAFQEIKQDDATKDIPVIMLSSLSALGDFIRQTPMVVRPQYFLDKPIAPAKLAEMIEKVLKG